MAVLTMEIRPLPVLLSILYLGCRWLIPVPSLAVSLTALHHTHSVDPQGEELFADYGKWYWAGTKGRRLTTDELQRFYDTLNMPRE